MRRTVATTLLLAASQLTSAFAIDKRDVLTENQDADYPDEVVFLAECSLYNDKDSHDEIVKQDLLLYYPTYDYVRNNHTLPTGDQVTPTYPKSQSIADLGKTHLDWTTAKDDDRITGQFQKIDKKFQVWGLDKNGDPETNVTGVADLGGKRMVCYSDPWAFSMEPQGKFLKCNAPYFCTRENRQIRRTVYDVYTTTTDVQIIAYSPYQIRKQTGEGNTDPHVEAVIRNAFYFLLLSEAAPVGVAYEYAIDTQLKKHTIRFDIQAGPRKSESTYSENQLLAITHYLNNIVTPELRIRATMGECTMGFESDAEYNCIYHIPFPSHIRVQVQQAKQKQLDWEASDIIDIYVDADDKADCGDGADMATVLSDLFADAGPVLSGGYSAVASTLGFLVGGYQTAVCL